MDSSEGPSYRRCHKRGSVRLHEDGLLSETTVSLPVNMVTLEMQAPRFFSVPKTVAFGCMRNLQKLSFELALNR